MLTIVIYYISGVAYLILVILVNIFFLVEKVPFFLISHCSCLTFSMRKSAVPVFIVVSAL